MIEAKQTRYRGVRFRSKLEAKWASVFDHFDLKWNYEPQRFYLRNNNGVYSPDFILDTKPKRIYVEIKPRFGLCTKENISAVLETGAPFLILDVPDPRCMAFPLYDDGKITDMCWCLSRDHIKYENRFYTDVGVFPHGTESIACSNCFGEFEGYCQPEFEYPEPIKFLPRRQRPND